MIAEYLRCRAGDAEWTDIMPGVETCCFAAEEGARPETMPPRLGTLHFEALFCRLGTLTLELERGSVSAGARDVLLLSDVSNVTSAQVEGPFAGILVAVDAKNARGILKRLGPLGGGLELATGRAGQYMRGRGGIEVLRATAWSRAVFESADSLPTSEQGRYCTLKAVELLYLLSAGVDGGAPNLSGVDGYIIRAVSSARAYMAAHLDDKLTIAALSRQFGVSQTSLKDCFRKMYGQPVHSYLLQLRIEKAKELLRTTSMSVLQVAQAVGYDGVSQFNAAFRRRVGVAPGKYRKMSESGGI